MNWYVLLRPIPIIRSHGKVRLVPELCFNIIHDSTHWWWNTFHEVIGLSFLAPTVQRILAVLGRVCGINFWAGLHIAPAELDEVRSAGERVIPKAAAQGIWQPICLVARSDGSNIFGGCHFLLQPARGC